jgi:DNA-directed RNA polymerase subunit beta'
VAELFEARKPRDPAIISHIDGVVELSSSGRGMRKIRVVPKVGKEREYVVPHGKHLNVHTGDRVVAGQQLIDGPIVPQDILKVSGEETLRKYLLDEIQEVYRLQGVKINAKHIEIIIRQMLRKIRIESPGDTSFLANEEIDKVVFREENEKVIANGGEPATAEPLLLGITKASLGTESFIAAASFQQTTRVLTDAAMRGKEDYLKGLKENVIIGRLIPAGTGSVHYRDTQVLVEEQPEEVEVVPAGEEEQTGKEEAVA